MFSLMSRIDKSLAAFRNVHPLSSEGYLSPNQLWIKGLSRIASDEDFISELLSILASVGCMQMHSLFCRVMHNYMASTGMVHCQWMVSLGSSKLKIACLMMTTQWTHPTTMDWIYSSPHWLLSTHMLYSMLSM